MEDVPFIWPWDKGKSKWLPPERFIQHGGKKRKLGLNGDKSKVEEDLEEKPKEATVGMRNAGGTAHHLYKHHPGAKHWEGASCILSNFALLA